MPVDIDAKNLCISCPAETVWSELAGAARKKGFFVPVQPLSHKATVADWLMEDLPSRGVLGYGPPYSAIRKLELTAGSGADITTGYTELSDFASSSNLSALMLGSRGQLAKPRRAAFKLVPLGELRRMSYSVPVTGLLPMVEEVLKGAPALYHIEFYASGGEATVLIIAEGDAKLCILADKRIEQIAMKTGASRAESRSLYEAAKGGEEWRVPLPALRETIEKLSAAGQLAGIVERGCVRIKAAPSEDISRIWGEKGYIMLQSQEVSEGASGLSARLKRVFDPDGTLCPKSKLSAAASKLGEEPAPPLFNLHPNMTEAQKEELGKLVGEKNVSFDNYDRLLYSHDLAPLPREVELVFKRIPDAVVLVRKTDDVVKLVGFSSAHDIPLVPRGGASWGFGGCVPTMGGIVVDLSFMMGIEIQQWEQLAVCEPGATWKQVTKAAEKIGLTVGAYPGSNPVATVAGWLSTNGAGLCSYKYGTAYEQVAWVEAVLADGSVVNTREAPLSLSALFAGAEGTLGIITKVAVKLRPIPECSKPLAYSAPSLEALAGPLEALTRSPIGPLHIALFDGAHFRYMKLLGKHVPQVGGMLFAVLEGTREGVAEEEKLLDEMMLKHGAEKLPEEVAEHEWEERFYELRARRLGPGGVLGEAVIPVGAFGNVAVDLQGVANELGMLASINGVVVDRNTIALMPYFITDERSMLRSLGGAMGFVKKIVDVGVAHGGRPSGLGIFFAGNMDKLHDIETASMITYIKEALDPHYIINPGKHTEMKTRYGIPILPFLVDYGMAIMALLKRGMPDRLPSGEELEKRLKGVDE
jgi:glycolate oxidase